MKSRPARRTLLSMAFALACAATAAQAVAPPSARAADQPATGAATAKTDVATAAIDPATAIPMFGDLPAAAAEAATSAAPGAEKIGGNAPLRRRGAGSASSAAPSGQAAPSDSSSWLRTVLSLAAVTGLILLLAWGYRAVMRGAGGAWLARPRQPAVLDVLARTAVTQRLGLCLVRVGPRMVLVGVGTDRLTALDVIDDADLTAKLAGHLAAPHGAASRTAPDPAEIPDFRQMLAREADESLGAPADSHAISADEPESADDVRLLRLRGQLSGALQRLRAAAGAE